LIKPPIIGCLAGRNLWQTRRYGSLIRHLRHAVQVKAGAKRPVGIQPQHLAARHTV
jgi:hypothetical protein